MARYSRSKNKALPIILVVGIIVIAIIILVSIMRAIFFPGTDSVEQVKVDISEQSLLDTSADRAVRLVVRGPIVADEDFRSYRITVTPSERRIQTFNGYLESQIEQKSYGNNVRAYEEFVHALKLADLTVGRQFEGVQNDIRGVCATGRVSEYSLLKSSEVVNMLWTSTCKGSPGSLRASSTQLTNLFVNQIPEGSEITRKISL